MISFIHFMVLHNCFYSFISIVCHLYEMKRHKVEETQSMEYKTVSIIHFMLVVMSCLNHLGSAEFCPPKPDSFLPSLGQKEKAIFHS